MKGAAAARRAAVPVRQAEALPGAVPVRRPAAPAVLAHPAALPAAAVPALTVPVTNKNKIIQLRKASMR